MTETEQAALPWTTRRWTLDGGAAYRLWPEGLRAAYDGYVGTPEEFVAAVRATGRCGPRPIRSGFVAAPPHAWASDLLRVHQEESEPERAGRLYCAVWDEAPRMMWDGARNTYGPEHILALAPPRYRTADQIRELEILFAQLRVAYAQFQLDQLTG